MTYYPKTYEEVEALCAEVHSLLDQAIREGWKAHARESHTVADILSRKGEEDSVEGGLWFDDFMVGNLLWEMAKADAAEYPLFSVTRHLGAGCELMRLSPHYPKGREVKVKIEEQIWDMDRVAHGERLEHPNDVTPEHAKRFAREFRKQV